MDTASSYGPACYTPRMNGTKAPRQRRFFQLHLSTCVVLMIVAGGLLFGNLAERTWSVRGSAEIPGHPELPVPVLHFSGTGWPFVTDRTATTDTDWKRVRSERPLRIAANIALGVALLGLAGFAGEAFVRRRSRVGAPAGAQDA